MKKLAIIGTPVAHSHSPAMHNFISKTIGADYIYEAIEVLPENLQSAAAELRRGNYAGFNVTAPHKQSIIQYLDEISEEARLYGAVNTVVNRNGRLCGYNTDARGFYMSLKRAGIETENADILIYGAGGAAQPVIMHLAAHGARSVTIINRSREKAELIAQRTQNACGIKPETDMKLPHYDIAVNCTTLGMGKNAGLSPAGDMHMLDASSAAADMIYNPPETEFLKQAKAVGAKTVNGLGMLVYQGILAYELFTGISLDDNIADKIFTEVFGI